MNAKWCQNNLSDILKPVGKSQGHVPCCKASNGWLMVHHWDKTGLGKPGHSVVARSLRAIKHN